MIRKTGPTLNGIVRELFSLALCLLLPISAAAEQLLRDPHFDKGYVVISPHRNPYTGHAREETVHRHLEAPLDVEPSRPDWRLVQWGSGGSIAQAPARPLADGGLRWDTADYSANQESVFHKSVALYPEGGVELALDGSSGRMGYLQSSREPWPHLLLAQDIESRKLYKYAGLELSLDARLLYDEQNIDRGYKLGLHAARFPVAIAVRNTLSNHTFWLTLVLYDDRYEKSGFICRKCSRDENGVERCRIPDSMQERGSWRCPVDGNRWADFPDKQGTGRVIFRVPTDAFTQENIRSGNWTHYQINLLPYLQEGIHAAQQTTGMRDYTDSLRFYDIRFISLGWEITGRNRAAMVIRNLSLQGL